MKKFNIKTIIIAAILALALIGATVAICISVFKGAQDSGNAEDAGDIGHIDDGGWTWD